MSRPPQSVLRAAMWMMGSVISLVAIAVAGRELTRAMPFFEVIFFRNALGLVILVPILLAARENRCRTRRIGGHALRSAVHFGAQSGWFYGLTRLPLGELTALEFTAPVWTAVLAAVILRERLSRRRIAGTLLGFAGVLVILRPGVGIVDHAALVVLLAASGFALMYVLTRNLAASEHPLTILFWMSVFQLPIALTLALPDWTPPSLALSPWILVVGVSGFAVHYCLTRALTYANAATVAPIDFVRLPLVVLIGFLVYAEAIDVFILLGAIVIFFGNHLNMTAGTSPPATRAARAGSQDD